MLEKVLIPLDGSRLSHGILTFVRRLVLHERSELKLVRVVTSEELDELTEAEARELARGHLARVTDILRERDLRATFAVLEGDAAEEILARADEYRPSLIAMASHGRSGITRWIRGSVAERLLRSSPFPLLLANTVSVAPTPWWGGEEGSQELAFESAFKRILVPLDGSARSNAVVPLVAEIAKIHDSEVCLLHVAKLGAARVPSSAFEPALDQLPGVKRSLEVVEGAPATAILDAVSARLFDLVALTSHGASGESPWPFGSTAEHVLRYCPAPLLVQRTSGLIRTKRALGSAASKASVASRKPSEQRTAARP